MRPDLIKDLLRPASVSSGPIIYRRDDGEPYRREPLTDKCEHCYESIHEIEVARRPYQQFKWVHALTGEPECAERPVASPLGHCYSCGRGVGCDE